VSTTIDAQWDVIEDVRTDDELVDATRAGDVEAYGVLWKRHAPTARRVARAITSAFDPDDLVAESFAAVLSAIRSGGGPRDGFRPYLFAAIRNTAATWGSRSKELATDDLDARSAPADDPVERYADRALMATAFRSLPERWRTLLWYLEVEGMKPREIAPLMGMSPNAVSALAYRARDGFRQAWLAGHIAEQSRPAECAWVCERVIATGKKPLPRADRGRFEGHLRACRACQIVVDDVKNVSQRLRAIMIPLVLGGTASVGLLPSGADSASAHTGSASAIPRTVHRSAGSLPGMLLVAAGVVAALIVAAGTLAAVAAVLPAQRSAADSAIIARPLSAPVDDAASSRPTTAPRPAATPRAAQPTRPQVVPAPAPAPPRAPSPVAPSAAAPQPPSDPVSEEPDAPVEPQEPPAVPRFTMTLAPAMPVPPVLSGVAEPGATLEILDELGAVLVSTQVGVDGVFFADVSGDALRQGMTLFARVAGDSADETGTSGGLGPLTCATPAVSSPSGDHSLSMTDLDGDGDADDARVEITGLPGAYVSLLIDGIPQQPVLIPDAGSASFDMVDVHLGSHELSLRYLDGVGRSGVAVDHHVIVVPGSPDAP
jgi:RNA polymerase sigma factor (sigma-70 family)